MQIVRAGEFSIVQRERILKGTLLSESRCEFFVLEEGLGFLIFFY